MLDGFCVMICFRSDLMALYYGNHSSGASCRDVHFIYVELTSGFGLVWIVLLAKSPSSSCLVIITEHFCSCCDLGVMSS